MLVHPSLSPPPDKGSQTRHDRDCVTIGQLSTPRKPLVYSFVYVSSRKVGGLGGYTVPNGSYIYLNGLYNCLRLAR